MGLFGTSPGGLDNQKFAELQNLAGSQNRRISMDEWLGVGGAPTEYYKLYGGTINSGLYGSYANQAGAAGTQMTPQQWMEAGGQWENYHQLYGTTPLAAAPQFGTPYTYTNPTDAASSLQGQQQADTRNLSLQDYFNRVNESGPYGTATYSLTPDGRVVRNYNLSAAQGAINNQREATDIDLGAQGSALLDDIRRAFGNPMDFSSLPSVMGADQLSSERKRIEDQVYGSFNRQFEPIFSQQQKDFEQKMADRGIPAGSELYNRLASQLAQQQNNARLDAQTRASELGGTELQRSFDISGQSRDRSISELIQKRYAPAQELGQILGLQRGVVNPDFSQISNLSIPRQDVTGTGLGYSELANRLAVAKTQADAQVRSAQIAGATSRANAQLAAETARAGQGGGDDGLATVRFLWDRNAAEYGEGKTIQEFGPRP